MFKVGDIICGTKKSDKLYRITNSEMHMAYVAETSRQEMEIVYLTENDVFLKRYLVINDDTYFNKKESFDQNESIILQFIKFFDNFLYDKPKRQNIKFSTLIFNNLRFDEELKKIFLVSYKNKKYFNTFLNFVNKKYNTILYYKG